METLYSATVLGSSVYLILWFFVIYSFLGERDEGPEPDEILREWAYSWK